MRSKWLNVGVIVFTTILWSMQMLPEKSDNEYFFLPFLRDHKYWITFASFGIIVGYHLFDILVERNKIQKKWVKKFLEHIVNLDLGGNNYHTRVSVLRAKKGYRIFLSRLWYLFIIRFFENFKEHSWLQSFRQIPIHLFSEYLYVYQRYSFPKGKRSYTCFRVRKNNGVAVKCYKEGVDCEIMTSCISDIVLPDKFSQLKQLNTSQQKRVKKYMHDSYIADNNYETLLSMVIRANNIYATPIIIDQQQVWGVLIIDNDEQQPVSFKKKIDPVIERYIKLFSYTISHLKMK